MDAAFARLMSPRASSVTTAMLVRLGRVTNRTLVLPLLIFYPTSRCNSRCISCDWWKQSGADDLTLDEIAQIAEELPPLGTRVVAFSGGEPLLRHDVLDAASIFRARGLSLQLLTSGVLLERLADGVARHFSRVFVSLDAASDRLYEEIRGINALGAVERGIARLRRLAPHVPVTARATIHRANFRELPRLIDHAKMLGIDGISFLAADLSSTAFGRGFDDPSARRPGSEPGASELRRPFDPGRFSNLALSPDEASEFADIVERTIAVYRAELESGFVAETPERLRRLPRYYRALTGNGPLPAVQCNAPWVSVVLEANGAVRPCFFHPPVGNIRRTPFEYLLKRSLPAFRAGLDVSTDPTCARCVCTLNAGWRNAPWAS
jgi:Fe-coproporphyrin III synthase